MPKLLVITRDGKETAVESEAGFSVMQVIVNNGIQDAFGICGGNLNCGSCHLYVDTDFIARLPPMHRYENGLLDTVSDRTTASRLGCQIPFIEELDNLRVRIAPED